MHILLINLERQPERLDRMDRIFNELGLRFSKVSAIDRKQLSTEEIRSWRSPEPSAPQLLPGETACFLSHRKCWRRIVEEGLPFAAIFEDDVHLGSDVAALLQSGDWIPEAADIVKIETKLHYVNVDKLPLGTIGSRTIHWLKSSHLGSAGYIVTARGAAKLLDMSEKLVCAVDQFMFNFDLPSATSLSVCQVLPGLCVQDFFAKKLPVKVGIGSDLHDERAGARAMGMTKVWREIKRPCFQFQAYVIRFLSSLTTDRRWVFARFG